MRDNKIEQLTDAYQLWLPDQDGLVTYKNAEKHLKEIMDIYSKTSLYDFIRRMDRKKDGFIDLEEFLHTFELAFTQSVSQSDIPQLKQECERIGKKIKNVNNLNTLFKKIQMQSILMAGQNYLLICTKEEKDILKSNATSCFLSCCRCQTKQRM
eukprot:TRINITY_DN23080_c0_g1_i1.p1 TRINITY_DN23080_c0_g1~~TRINITY_DN23080_c0_g1_i1.p1  ORF type:complete len:154 (+),score=22.20 TRINITY_DN23080_c0_g1_i1:222-683(+)